MVLEARGGDPGFFVTPTDWALVRRLTTVIGKHSLLAPEAAKELAINIVNWQQDEWWLSRYPMHEDNFS